jgi:putative glutamine amidotransferase
VTEERPRIGIVGAARTEFEHKAFQAYVEAIESAGGTPVPVLPGAGLDALDRVDGLVLTGGLDVDPKEYGQDADPAMAVEIDAERDALELPLVREAVRRDLPMLAICRGIQVLNVALGGTLIQHIPDEVPSALAHEQPNPRTEAGHVVRVSAGTLLHRITGAEELSVNSAHHQAVKALAPGFIVDATAPDGIIEGIEDPRRRFLIGVQWHPEYAISEGDTRLFAAFIEASHR